jgi:hypothetical protein
MTPLRSSHHRDPNREHLLHDGAAVVELVFRLADRWLEWRCLNKKIAISHACNSGSPIRAKPGGQND